jgi:4'-phosphopantetheinyl transferase
MDPVARLEIWWTAVDDCAPELERLLTAAEDSRLRRYRRVEDRRRCLAAWALARIVLGERLGMAPESVPIARRCLACASSEHGKPYVDLDRDLEFSLSHAGDRVVLALAGGLAVGIDVEETSREVDEIARLVFAPEENRTTGVDLLRTWVRKEAVSKATGHGLGLPMRDYAVSAAREPARLLTWPSDPTLPRRLTLIDLAADPGYVAAAAVIGPVEETTIRRLRLPPP